MRNLLIAVWAMIMFGACQPPRYTEQSPEIDVAKQLIEGYVSNDYSAYEGVYSDTARIYYNSAEPITLDEVIKGNKEQHEIVSDIKFEDDIEFEFVTADNGKQWVSWWGMWHGKFKATGQEFAIPVHVSAEFVDGKIVEEWGYWDNQPIAEAIAKQAAKQAAAEAAANAEVEE
jgi:SnoaL-like polyketide cyclase